MGELRHDRAEFAELGTHLGLDLIETGVDDVFLGRQLCRRLVASLLGRRAELLALEHGCLVERGVHGCVAIGRRLEPHLRERAGDRFVDDLVDG